MKNIKKRTSVILASAVLSGSILAPTTSVFANQADYMGSSGIYLIQRDAPKNLSASEYKDLEEIFGDKIKNVPSHRKNAYLEALYGAALADKYIRDNSDKIDNFPATHVDRLQRMLNMINDTRIGYRYTVTGDIYGEASPLVIKNNYKNNSKYVNDIYKIIDHNFGDFDKVPEKDRKSVSNALDAAAYLDFALSGIKFGTVKPSPDKNFMEAVRIMNSSPMGEIVNPNLMTTAYLNQRANITNKNTSEVFGFTKDIKKSFDKKYLGLNEKETNYDGSTSPSLGNLEDELKQVEKENQDLLNELSKKRGERAELERQAKDKEKELKEKQNKQNDEQIKKLKSKIEQEKSKNKTLKNDLKFEEQEISKLKQLLSSLSGAIISLVKSIF